MTFIILLLEPLIPHVYPNATLICSNELVFFFLIYLQQGRNMKTYLMQLLKSSDTDKYL